MYCVPGSEGGGAGGLDSWVRGRRGWVSPWPAAAAPSPPQPAAGAAPFGQCLGRGPCSWEQGRDGASERSPVSSPPSPHLLPDVSPIPGAAVQQLIERVSPGVSSFRREG